MPTTRFPNVLLQRERLGRHWTQQTLADAIGTTAITVSRWERGLTRPGPYFRRKLCSLFQKSEQHLGIMSETTLDGSAREEQHEAVLSDPALPAANSSGLIGRKALLAQIKTALLARSTRPFVAVSGLPGVGKTALVAQIAHDPFVRAHFADGILWAELGSRPALPDILRRWGTLLGLSLTEMNNLTSLDAWALALREAIGQRRLLLVLDNAWQREHIMALCVGGPQCRYVLTTRALSVAWLFAGHEVLQVEELAEEEGLLLLRRFSPLLVTQDAKAARSLVQAVGGLPLALEMMGTFLRLQERCSQPPQTDAALHSLLNIPTRFSLTHQHIMGSPHPGFSSAGTRSLRTVIGQSVDALTEEARRTLLALSLFPAKPGSFSEAAALAVSDTEAEVLDQLTDAGVLEARKPDRYTLHPTIVDYARLERATSGETREAKRRLVAYYTRYVEMPGNAGRLAEEGANIFVALQIAFQQEMHASLIRLCLAFLPDLERRGWYAAARKQLSRSMEAARLLKDQAMLTRLQEQLERIVQQQKERASRELAHGRARQQRGHAGGGPEQASGENVVGRTASRKRGASIQRTPRSGEEA